MTSHSEQKGGAEAMREVVQLVADDCLAATCETVEQYRAALLGRLAEMLGAEVRCG